MTTRGGTPPLPFLRFAPAAHLVDGGNNLEQLVVGEVLERELPLRHVPGVRFPEHRVTVPGDHLCKDKTNKNTPNKYRHERMAARQKRGEGRSVSLSVCLAGWRSGYFVRRGTSGWAVAYELMNGDVS